jgi:hypothetical protein
LGEGINDGLQVGMIVQLIFAVTKGVKKALPNRDTIPNFGENGEVVTACLPDHSDGFNL